MRRTYTAILIPLFLQLSSGESVDLDKHRILSMLFDGKGAICSNDSSAHVKERPDGYGRRASDAHVHWYATSDEVRACRFCCNVSSAESLYTRVIYVGVDRYDTAHQAFVATETVPPNYDCASCSAAIGIGLLVRDMSGWQIAVYQPRVLNLGTGGFAPAAIDQVRLAPNKTGLAVNWDMVGQQIWKSGIAFVALVDNGFKDILRMTAASNDSTTCAKGTAPCWGYTSSYKIGPDRSNGFFNIQQHLTGSRLAEKQIVKIDENVVYRFNGNRYVNRK